MSDPSNGRNDYDMTCSRSSRAASIHPRRRAGDGGLRHIGEVLRVVLLERFVHGDGPSDRAESRCWEAHAAGSRARSPSDRTRSGGKPPNRRRMRNSNAQQ